MYSFPFPSPFFSAASSRESGGLRQGIFPPFLSNFFFLVAEFEIVRCSDLKISTSFSLFSGIGSLFSAAVIGTFLLSFYVKSPLMEQIR